jgi:hypothetical protein
MLACEKGDLRPTIISRRLLSYSGPPRAPMSAKAPRPPSAMRSDRNLNCKNDICVPKCISMLSTGGMSDGSGSWPHPNVTLSSTDNTFPSSTHVRKASRSPEYDLTTIGGERSTYSFSATCIFCGLSTSRGESIAKASFNLSSESSACCDTAFIFPSAVCVSLLTASSCVSSTAALACRAVSSLRAVLAEVAASSASLESNSKRSLLAFVCGFLMYLFWHLRVTLPQRLLQLGQHLTGPL